MSSTSVTATPTSTQRRRLLLASAAAIGAVALPATTAAHDNDLSALFADPESARQVGLRYLAFNPTEQPVAATLARRLHKLDPRRGIDTLRRDVAARIRREFAAGRTVELDGWVLSRLEARLCAALTCA